ncbi:hypothetical protein SETIT_9G399400v2, partial [Setaria italica]|uniref:DUF1618 domain-containing protein n=1 Tax=Setaria italica TaxID=4555 RepID=K4AJX2_SETIT
LVSLTGNSFHVQDDAEPEGGLVRWVREGLVRVTVDEPTRLPDILTVSLHLRATPAEIACHLEGVTVVGVDHHFIVLNTGPKLHDFASSGHYLVHDTREEKLHLVPPIDLNEYREDFGRVPVIITGAGAGASSDFLLALKHSLFVFTGNHNDNHWIRKERRLPGEVTEYSFRTDVSFPIHGGLACWVDLNLGIMLCDLRSDDPCVRFVPLPEDYGMISFALLRGRPNVYSTAGFVDGSLRLVYMDGYDDEEFPRDQVIISTWSYKGGLDIGEPGQQGEWVREHGAAALRVGELLADTSFRAVPGLPERVVYFFSSDLAFVDGHVATRGEHVLCLNMESKKVQSWRKCPPGRSFQLIPFLIGVELPVDPRFSDLYHQATSQLKHLICSIVYMNCNALMPETAFDEN